MTHKFAYQIYLRSFFDSNNDGIGDLNGVTAKIEYLQQLGVDVIWLSPFYATPDHDNGYDVADYTSVDPKFGTIGDFDRLVQTARSAGIEVMLDIVPNHTSSEHEWFLQAVVDPTSKYRDYYLFRDAPDGTMPNNWLSVFGGPAWSPSPAEGDDQVYCHLFLKEQPDLDWSNPDVWKEFDAIFAFWIDRGVTSFRIDVSQGMKKELRLADNRQLRELTDDMGPLERFYSFEHVNDWHRPESLEIFRWWRKQLGRQGATVYGEFDSDSVDELVALCDGGRSLNGFFMLSQTRCGWDAQLFENVNECAQALGESAVWYYSSHDAARIATRFGGGDAGCERALALFAYTALLDGLHFLYNGEELGLEDAVITGDLRDPIALRNASGAHESRDPCRSVMPWDTSAYNGFSYHLPWLESKDRAEPETVVAQQGDEQSWFARYRNVIAWSKANPELVDAPIEALGPSAYRRGPVTVIANTGATPIPVVDGVISVRTSTADDPVVHPNETVYVTQPS